MKGISEGVFSRYFLYSGKSPHFLRPAASNNGIPKNKFIIIHWFYMFKAAFRIHLTLTIHLFVIVDSDPRIHIWKKWIRIWVQSGSGSEYQFSIFFIKKFMSDKLQYLFLLPPFRKGISQIKKKTFSFALFWCYPDPNQCFLK